MYGLRGLGSFCDDNPTECYAGAPIVDQSAAIQAALAAAASGACTCVAGLCKETGNSCAAAGSAPFVPAPQTFTSWINQNGTMVGLGVAAVFGLLAVSKR